MRNPPLVESLVINNKVLNTRHVHKINFYHCQEAGESLLDELVLTACVDSSSFHRRNVSGKSTENSAENKGSIEIALC